MKLIAYALFTCWALASSATAAEPTTLNPTQSVYKCEVDGKVAYTDEPCLGAEKLDVQPTRGMNKSTGRELTGADVLRERRREQLAESLRPLSSMTAQQFDAQARRHKLPTAAQSECSQLDVAIPRGEASERAAVAMDKIAAQQRLLAHRQRYRELRC